MDIGQGISIEEVGQRLKAFRVGAGLSPEEVAQKTGISRAAIYRYELGQPIRVDTLGKIATLLGISLPTLLGVGVEYIASAVSFFERMRQIEEKVDQILVLFGPVSYLLTTDAYDAILPDVLKESIPLDVEDRAKALQDIEALLDILHARKVCYHNRMPSIISLVSAAELEQFFRNGFIGAYDPPEADMKLRREVARTEIENIVKMLREPPIGTQIGLVVDSMPSASFQIFKQADRSQVAVSPFRLGAFANIRLGVATISAAPEATSLYGAMTDKLWRRSLKGDQAADFIEKTILRA
ncbi:helix-turn-helix domain-containing protein [Cohaesibacter marisflavi]|uniref:Transcriptional regulator, contains XRE-family HTH domain n=1 Tax=Cohaesibacter marisflavi TaxID=655353 RepID=A0A1I5DI74_9HYPH|nr:helix-turn-helix transcriptional regulator [Cohaesibacter marisflavi]SFN98903.1 Transcriptional regulator, contains XRE-family HTH domain [Cohaesibacter marisflavi]